jgi:hypothetical protein
MCRRRCIEARWYVQPTNVGLSLRVVLQYTPHKQQTTVSQPQYHAVCISISAHFYSISIFKVSVAHAMAMHGDRNMDRKW